MIFLVKYIGTYLSVAVFLGAYMRLIGKHGWIPTLSMMVGSVFFIYFLFEWQLAKYLPKDCHFRRCVSVDRQFPLGIFDVETGWGKHMFEIVIAWRGVTTILEPLNLFMIFAGCLAGLFIGTMPGLGSVNGVAILLPVFLGPPSAIIFLAPL